MSKEELQAQGPSQRELRRWDGWLPVELVAKAQWGHAAIWGRGPLEPRAERLSGLWSLDRGSPSRLLTGASLGCGAELPT